MNVVENRASIAMAGETTEAFPFRFLPGPRLAGRKFQIIGSFWKKLVVFKEQFWLSVTVFCLPVNQ